MARQGAGAGSGGGGTPEHRAGTWDWPNDQRLHTPREADGRISWTKLVFKLRDTSLPMPEASSILSKPTLTTISRGSPYSLAKYRTLLCFGKCIGKRSAFPLSHCQSTNFQTQDASDVSQSSPQPSEAGRPTCADSASKNQSLLQQSNYFPLWLSLPAIFYEQLFNRWRSHTFALVTGGEKQTTPSTIDEG